MVRNQRKQTKTTIRFIPSSVDKDETRTSNWGGYRPLLSAIGCDCRAKLCFNVQMYAFDCFLDSLGENTTSPFQVLEVCECFAKPGPWMVQFLATRQEFLASTAKEFSWRVNSERGLRSVKCKKKEKKRKSFSSYNNASVLVKSLKTVLLQISSKRTLSMTPFQTL